MSSDPLITMQDHDLLIQLHTKLDGLVSKLSVLDQLDSRMRELEGKDQRHSEKISNIMTEMSYVKQTTVQLARINAIEEDVKGMQNDIKSIREKQITTDRIDAIAADVQDLKKKSNLADILIGAGAFIGSLISYFK